jgi:nucleoside 2-deoxyribosyltransferase
MRKSIYFAAPLFNPQELEFNEKVSAILENSFSVHLPQRDGVLIPGNAWTEQDFKEMSRRAFVSDLDAIRRCDVLFAVLDGRVVDEGVAFELGFAAALGKQCVALRTDKRVLLPHGINPMIDGGLSVTLYSLEDVSGWIFTNR